MHIVVFDEGYSTLKLPVCGQSVHLVNEMLRWEIGGIGLASEYYLDGVPPVFDNPFEAFHIMEDQRRTLVLSKSADKTYSQHIVIEQCPHGHPLLECQTTLSPPGLGT